MAMRRTNAPLGETFAPTTAADEIRKPTPAQMAIQVLSMRLPRVVGARTISPLVRNSPGGGGGMTADLAVLQSILRGHDGPTAPPLAGLGDVTAGSPTSPINAPLAALGDSSPRPPAPLAPAPPASSAQPPSVARPFAPISGSESQQLARQVERGRTESPSAPVITPGIERKDPRVVVDERDRLPPPRPLAPAETDLLASRDQRELRPLTPDEVPDLGERAPGGRRSLADGMPVGSQEPYAPPIRDPEGPIDITPPSDAWGPDAAYAQPGGAMLPQVWPDALVAIADMLRRRGERF